MIKQDRVRKFSWWFFIAAVLSFFGNESCYAQVCASQIIRQHIEAENFFSPIHIGKEKINQPDLLALFYSKNGYALSWNDKKNVAEIYTALYFSTAEGLNRSDYHFDAIHKYLYKFKPNEFDLAYFDMLLTDAFFTYSMHLFSGKIDPELLYPGKWKKEKREIDLVSLLEHTLANKIISAMLDELKPELAEYAILKGQLTHFRRIKSNGGWPEIPDGPALVLGDSSERISRIKERLFISGLIPDQNFSRGDVYDTILEKGIINFQSQHGLIGDGVIGPRTLQALNRTVDAYINTILINLERLRWLSRDIGDKYVLVNIPDYQLQVRHKDSVVLTMKTIVGRPERSTPVFSSNIRYLIINPTWTVPPTILREDILPAVKRDIRYLQRNKLRVFSKNGEEVKPDSLPWRNYTANNFPYLIKQDPGLTNSMGLIKFQFPNHYGVFLHDTNAPYLFNQSYRALSSGCIRIEHPFALATYLLESTGWTKDKLAEEVTSGKTRTIVFSELIRIHLLYLTVFTDSQHGLQWRDDIYFLDDALLSALNTSVK